MCPCGTSSGSSSLQDGGGQRGEGDPQTLSAPPPSLRPPQIKGKEGNRAPPEPHSHLSQDVTHDLPVLILGDVGELGKGEKGVKGGDPDTRRGDPGVWERGRGPYLGPGEAVIEIIFHLVVLGQAEQVAVLHVHQVLGLAARRVRAGASRSAPGGWGATPRGGGDAPKRALGRDPPQNPPMWVRIPL